MMILMRPIKNKLLATLAVLAATLTAYNASDYYAAGANYWRRHTEWCSENYKIDTSPCYICFHSVDYWQKKGTLPRDAEALCSNCGLTNTYSGDTLPLSLFGDRLIYDKSQAAAKAKADGRSTQCEGCKDCGRMNCVNDRPKDGGACKSAA